jgi:hypothetical protein
LLSVSDDAGVFFLKVQAGIYERIMRWIARDDNKYKVFRRTAVKNTYSRFSPEREWMISSFPDCVELDGAFR